MLFVLEQKDLLKLINFYFTLNARKIYKYCFIEIGMETVSHINLKSSVNPYLCGNIIFQIQIFIVLIVVF